MGGTLLQKQGDEWVVIGYHSKRLPKSAKNFGISELELTGLLVNSHGFMQLLCNRYFEVLVDHKAIEYMIKSKTESPMTRLKTLLLKLSEYTIELKYQKGSKMHTSDTLSRLHNFTDTPDQKDVIPLNFLQHFKVAEALIYRVICLFGPPRQSICDEATKFSSVISPYNHGSSKCERQIQMISEIIMKHQWDKGQMWPLFATTATYAMNTFASEALSGLSPFQLVFLRDPPNLTSLSFPKIDTIPVKHREYYNLLLARAQLVGNLLLEWRTKQALEYESRAKKLRNEEIFQDNQMVYLLALHASVLQTNTMKFKQGFIG